MLHPVSSAARSRSRDLPPDFGDQLYSQLRNAPWLLASAGFHAAVVGLWALWPVPPEPAPEVERISMASPEAFEELLEEPEPEVPEVKPPEQHREVPETPDREAVVEDDPQTDDDEPDEEARGDPNFLSDSPFDSTQLNGVIGIGGGRGGQFGEGGIGGHRKLKIKGTGAATRNAVDLALEWLKNHQSPDGRWDSDGFDAECKLNECDGRGEAVYDPGLSGLALLCFLGTGQTHQSGEYKDSIKQGLKYLKNVQDSEGCFGPRTSQHFQYNHMCAALAMTEAYGLTGSRLFKDSAQRGVDFVHQSQNPYLAWRYGVRDGDNDTSVTGWAVMVLKSAVLAELEVDKGAFRGAMAWVEKMTEPEFGRTGYQQRGGPPARTNQMIDTFPAGESESMTAVGVLTRIFCAANSDADPARDEMVRKGSDLMVKKLPRWDVDAGTIDFYYWYYASLALFQVGGSHWKAWNEAMESEIVAHQRLEEGRDERGSWDPLDPWAPEGGRIYSTALNCLSLEVYYRYPRIFVGSR